MYSLTFQINLLNDDAGTLLQPDDLENFADRKHSWMPSCGVAGLPNISGKHGDTFTLYGNQARRLKKLLEDNDIADIVVL